MESQIIEIDANVWNLPQTNPDWIAGLERGKVLYVPHLPFELLDKETRLLDPQVRDPKARNISLDANGQLKGAIGDEVLQQDLANMIGRFRQQAQSLIY